MAGEAHHQHGAGRSGEAALIACPVCDTLQREPVLAKGSRAECVRCHSVLMTSRSHAMTRIVMMAASALILMAAGVFFPFLRIRAGGIEQQSSLIDTALAYSTGLLVPLTFALMALIIVLPVVRFVAVIYVLAPMALGWAPASHAREAFRLSQSLKPWAMAEVFIVGVAVALVKISDLAQVTLGPAFFALCCLVIVNVLYDSLMCRFTVWKTLEARQAS